MKFIEALRHLEQLGCTHFELYDGRQFTIAQMIVKTVKLTETYNQLKELSLLAHFDIGELITDYEVYVYEATFKVKHRARASYGNIVVGRGVRIVS